MILAIGACGMASCSGGGDDNDELNDATNNSTIFNQLVGTSWSTKSTVFYTASGKATSSYDDTKNPDVITFTSVPYNIDGYYTLYIDYNKWHPYYDGYTKTAYWNVKNGEINSNIGGGNSLGEILKLTSTELQTKYTPNVAWDDGNAYRIETYTRTTEPSHKIKPSEGDNNGSTSGSTTSYEKPDIGYYDCTPTKTSLKVVYKIYNKNEAKVSSARIYYGKSSASTSKTATVSGTLITATITGLKAGTDYYIKCKATGKGGTTTTETTRVSTLY